MRARAVPPPLAIPRALLPALLLLAAGLAPPSAAAADAPADAPSPPADAPFVLPRADLHALRASALPPHAPGAAPPLVEAWTMAPPTSWRFDLADAASSATVVAAPAHGAPPGGLVAFQVVGPGPKGRAPTLATLAAGESQVFEVQVRNPENVTLTMTPRVTPLRVALGADARSAEGIPPWHGARLRAAAPDATPPESPRGAAWSHGGVTVRVLSDEPLRMRPGVAYTLRVAVDVPEHARPDWRLDFAIEGVAAERAEPIPLGGEFALRRLAAPVPGATAPPPSVMGTVLTTGLAVGGAFAAAWVATAPKRDEWKFLLLAPLVGLFTRLVRQDVLSHETRERLHALIRENPGITYTELRERTRLAPGVLVHHLRVLREHHVIQSRKEEGRRRHYDVGAPAPEAAPQGMRARVLQLARDGRVPQSAIAARLGITQQAVSYHVRALVAKGLLPATAAPRAASGRRSA